MSTLLLYLIKSTLCLSLLYTVYWLFLRRETFFQLNRLYMLTMVLFSMLFPLFPFHLTFSDSSAIIVMLLEPVMITPEKMEQTLKSKLGWIEIASVVYFTGLIIFILRLAVQLIQLHLIARRFGVIERLGHRLVFVGRGYSPFSFFNLVFINESMVPAGSLPTILEHERVHIRQVHSLDMIMLELATILQWFNPFIWLAGREMKNIHEYLADEGVLQNGISRSTYQQMILDETMGIRVNDLTNNFNVSLLKKRIAMMTKPKSKTWAKSKILIALPVLLALFFTLTARSFSNSLEAPVPGSPVLTPAHSLNDPVIQDKSKQETQVKTVPVKQGNDENKTIDKMPSFSGGHDALIKFLIANIKYPEEAMKKNVQGKVFVHFVVRSDGSITDVKIQRGIGGGCDEEALRVVKMMPKWNPGEDKGKPVAVVTVLPIKFALDSEKKEKPKN
ncbi:MAG: M56 family metallopeptidase [Bacteroidota bacterium]